jgi:hypothetical protein
MWINLIPRVGRKRIDSQYCGPESTRDTGASLVIDRAVIAGVGFRLCPGLSNGESLWIT